MMSRCSILLLLSLFVSSFSYSTPLADSLVYAQSFSDTTKKDQLLSQDIDVKSQPGNIILALGSTKNLGRFTRFATAYLGPLPPSTDPNVPDTTKINGNYLADNNFFTFVEFPVGNAGSYIKMDLRSIRRISSVVLVNLFNNPTTYRTRPRAFSLYSGLDSNSLSRIYQEVDNVDTASSKYTMNIADVSPIRYLRLSLDRTDVTQSTVISEIQIFGDGYVPSGSYVSKVDSFAQPVNFGNFHADADFEEGTSISVQIRTGNTSAVDSVNWSGWSAPVIFSSTAEAAAGKALNLKEPRKYFQYMVTLFTQNIGTPRVRGISMTYQQNLVANSTMAYISPDTIQAFTKTKLSYKINAVIASGTLGIDTIKIYTPSPVTLNAVTVNNAAVGYSSLVYPDKLIIGFNASITATSVIDISFTTRLITDATFPSEIISKSAAWNPQHVDPQLLGTSEAWKVYTEGLAASTVINLRVDPNPFTPNGDGKNDVTVVDFAVANIEKPKTLRIHIFDLSGRRVRVINESSTGINPYYGNPRSGGSGILWDGRNDDGTIVPPGVYLLQVSIDTDGGGEFLTKTVVVSY
jgi:hypothetical protein